MNNKYQDALDYLKHYIDDYSTISKDEMLYNIKTLQELIDKYSKLENSAMNLGLEEIVNKAVSEVSK